jgi:integrase
MDRGKGIRAKSKSSIEIDFTYRGVRCKETLRLPPTKPNMLHARRMREAILHEIALGSFRYEEHFPDSKRVSMWTKSTNKTVGIALDEFLAASKRSCADSTLRDYESAIRHHLRPTFGDRLMREVTSGEIKAWLGSLTISGKRINNILIPLRAVFQEAHYDELIDRNPLAPIRNLKHIKEEPDPFTLEEQALILNVAQGQERNLIQFAFATGLRTSELIALSWDDIDLEKRLAYVRKASVRGKTKSTKTTAGERTIKLFDAAIEALQAQRPITQLAGQQVFYCSRTGKPWETDQQIRKSAWTGTLKKAGVRYRNPYQTRHSFASIVLSSGEDPTWLARQMGHKDWGMIRRVYARWIPDVNPSAGSKVTAFSSRFGHHSSVSV